MTLKGIEFMFWILVFSSCTKKAQQLYKMAKMSVSMQMFITRSNLSLNEEIEREYVIIRCTFEVLRMKATKNIMSTFYLYFFRYLGPIYILLLSCGCYFIHHMLHVFMQMISLRRPENMSGTWEEMTPCLNFLKT